MILLQGLFYVLGVLQVLCSLWSFFLCFMYTSCVSSDFLRMTKVCDTSSKIVLCSGCSTSSMFCEVLCVLAM